MKTCIQPFHELFAPACPLPIESVDTDQLIPARFMKESRANGYGHYLLHDMRFDNQGKQQKNFVLNRPGMESAMVMVARRNFGAGSSREAAVYALVDFGFRCVITPGFGDIFASNAVNNGLLPAVVTTSDCEQLLAFLKSKEITSITVNLEKQTISFGVHQISFDINPTWKVKLINGWDDIDLTLAKTSKINSFRKQYLKKYPWLG